MRTVREKTFFCRYCARDKPQKGRVPTRPGCYKCADCHAGARVTAFPVPLPRSQANQTNPNPKGQIRMKPEIPMLSDEAFCLSEAWLLIYNQRRRAGDRYDHAKAAPRLVDAGPHGLLERPIMEVDIRGAAYYADAVTGTLYDKDSGACMTGALRLLAAEAEAA